MNKNHFIGVMNVWLKGSNKPNRIYVRSEGKNIYLSDNNEDVIVHQSNVMGEENWVREYSLVRNITITKYGMTYPQYNNDDKIIL